MIQAVGVVVPAHDEQDLLPSCLAGLRRAEAALRDTPVHLVVVADACRDRTAQAARRAGAAVVTIGARCVGAARAAGVREVLRQTRHLDPAAVWLANTDADTVVPASWLGTQTRYADSGWDAVAGTIRVGDWSGYPPVVRSLFRERYGARDSAAADEHPHVHGANLGFRAAAYLAAGGFRDTPTAEDHALVAAMAAAGSRVLQASDLTVVTSARRQARAPHGFSGYLADLAAESGVFGRQSTGSRTAHVLHQLPRASQASGPAGHAGAARGAAATSRAGARRAAWCVAGTSAAPRACPDPARHVAVGQPA